MDDILLSSQIQRELDVAETARKNAQNDLPNIQETQLDQAQEEILAALNDKVTQKKGKVRNSLNNKRDQRTELESKIEEKSDFTLVIEDIKNDFETFIKSKEKELESKFEDYKRAQRNLIAFKDRHNLKRQAHYPESMVWHFGIIALLLVFETILNSSVFSLGSSLGLLGGFFNAFIVSLINVAFGVITGYFLLPLFNHKDIKKNVIGGIGTSIYLLIIPFGFNLLVAHFRAVLEIDFQEAVITAFNNFISNPLNIQNVDSWVLFFLGLVISIVACFDGYKLDDPYPGYGHITRQHLKFKEAYLNFREKIYDSLNGIIKNGRQNLNSNLIGFRKYLSLLEENLEDSKRYVVEFNDDFLEKAVGAGKITINKYRETNSLVRNGNVPDYFSKEVSIDLDHHKVDDPDFQNAKDFLEIKKTKLTETEEKKSQILEKISSLREELKERLNNKFKDLEKEVDVNIA